MPVMPTRTKRAAAPAIEPIDPEPEIIQQSVDPKAEQQEPDTFTFKRTHFYALVTVLAFAAGVLLGYAVWGMPSGAKSSTSDGAAAETPKYTRYDVPSQGFYSIGPQDAPITIVEFSDFQCPYCRRWHQEVYEPLLAAYPGKIKLVYRNLPLTSIHPDALSAAEAAMCAGEQDAYWSYHDKLFGNDGLGGAVYVQYAQELSLDMQKFQDCIDVHRYKAAIQADSDFALNLGVSSTPTFFINGLAVVGAQPLNVFKQVIDKELAGEIPK